MSDKNGEVMRGDDGDAPPPYSLQPGNMATPGAMYTPMGPGYIHQGVVDPSKGIVYQQPQVMIVDNVGIQSPKDYKTFALLVSIFCCWPIGLLAVRKSKECRDAVDRGDLEEAGLLSLRTRKLAYMGLWIGVVCNILAIGLVVLMYIYWLAPLWWAMLND